MDVLAAAFGLLGVVIQAVERAQQAAADGRQKEHDEIVAWFSKTTAELSDKIALMDKARVDESQKTKDVLDKL